MALVYKIGFFFEYRTGKLFRACGSALMVRKLARGSGEKIVGTKAIRPICGEENAMRGTSFRFAEAARSQYLKQIWISLGFYRLRHRTCY